MAGGGGHSKMKHFWHATMMIHGFTLLPASLVVLVYSFGRMFLLGDWKLFFLCLVTFVICVIIFVVLSIAGE